MYCESYDARPPATDATLRERWLRLLFDMYGIRPPARLEVSLLPDSSMVRIVGASVRRRASLHGRSPVVLPFRSTKRGTSARREPPDKSSVEQADGDPSTQTPTEELPPPAAPSLPAEPPAQLPARDAGGARSDQAAVSPAADGDGRAPAGEDLH